MFTSTALRFDVTIADTKKRCEKGQSMPLNTFAFGTNNNESTFTKILLVY